MPTLPLRLGNVLHQPIDRVVGVSGVIDVGRILRSMQGTVHHVITFRAVLPADVLYDANVSAFDDNIRCVVIAVRDLGRGVNSVV